MLCRLVDYAEQDQLLSRTNSWQEATNSSDEQLDRRSDRWPEAAVAELREKARHLGALTGASPQLTAGSLKRGSNLG